jgi:acyl-CoA hydrolase
VTVRATVNAAWRTSMEVGVRVEREQVQKGDVEHTSTAYLTMVALDEDRRPVEVPPLAPQTEDEERRQREAELRRRNRLASARRSCAGGGEGLGRAGPTAPGPAARPRRAD